MLSISNLVADHQAGNEGLRYGHRKPRPEFSLEVAPRPVVVWAVTNACNLKCVHCYASATTDPLKGELTYDQGVALLDDLKQFNVPAILFSGGEPLVRPDVLRLLGYARQIGHRVTLSTNGLLIDDAMADRLAELGMQYIGISIDGGRQTHDRLRGLAGAFEGSMAAVKRCRDRGIKVGLRFTVHALNYQEMDHVIDQCLAYDVPRLCIYHLAYAGRGGKMQKVDLTTEQTRQVVERIFTRTAELHRSGAPLEVLTVANHADAAYAILRLEAHDPQAAAELHQRLRGTGGNQSGNFISSVDPLGNVHYDQFSWHYTCGNVKQTPFSEVWGRATDPRLKILRDRVAHLPEACQKCRFLDICNGNLRTRAEAATGDWLGFDPSCYLSASERAPRKV